MTATAQHRIEYLDWLRALAAALVMFGHSANQIAPGGAVGVSVFFVLSGYLIASILLRDGMMSLENIGKFIARRIIRIYPMYALQILLVVIFFYFMRNEHIDTVLKQVPGLLTFWRGPAGWFGHGFGVLWTLAVEFWFYVTFPFLLWAASYTRHLILCIWAGIACSVCAKVFAVGGDTLHYYDHFLIGSLCAAAIRFNVVPSFARWPKLFAFALIAILLISATPYPGTRGFLWFCQSLGTAAATGLIILAGHERPPAFSIPWAAFLGRISYSVYLMHAVILDVCIKANFPLDRWLYAYVAFVLLVSTATYFLVELKIERWAHRMIRYGSGSRSMPPDTRPEVNALGRN